MYAGNLPKPVAGKPSNLSKMKQSVFLLLMLSGLLCLQCDLINPEESVPAFLHIEAFTLQTDGPSQGSASHKITEGWLTVNDEFLGVYRLPATVPVLMEGNVRIYLEAGIKDNGIGSTPQIYPFYSPFETQVELLPEQTVQINPQTSYEPGTQFAFIENFESGSTIFQDVLFGAGQVEVSSNDPFEGSFSGKIQLSMDDPLLEVATIQAFPALADQSPQVYLEVD